ncbi:MAG: hypothetical protein RR738_04785 [Anaerorhabdus sp.]|uniref:hypothetical protein n=1 Tax=Anaerorhabdus sp. TaxID=1872524 RepID=UPI002FCA5A36
MKRDILDELIGMVVTVVLFDGDEITGELHKTGEEIFKDNPNLYIPKNRYVLIEHFGKHSCVFRSSHVTKLRIDVSNYIKK